MGRTYPKPNDIAHMEAFMLMNHIFNQLRPTVQLQDFYHVYIFSYHQPNCKRKQEGRSKSYKNFAHNPLGLWAIWYTPNGAADIVLLEFLSFSEKHWSTTSASRFQVYVTQINIYWFIYFCVPAKLLDEMRETAKVLYLCAVTFNPWKTQWYLLQLVGNHLRCQ